MCDSGSLLMERMGEGPCIWEVLANQDEESNTFLHSPKEQKSVVLCVCNHLFHLGLLFPHSLVFFFNTLCAGVLGAFLFWTACGCCRFSVSCREIAKSAPEQNYHKTIAQSSFNLFVANCSVIPLSGILKFQNSVSVKMF